MTGEDDEIEGAASRRWTDALRPTKHLPWPQLFRHHTLALTSHLKMMNMVLHHYPEGSANHTMAQDCVDRTHNMIMMFNEAASTFVPAHDKPDRVPVQDSTAPTCPECPLPDRTSGKDVAQDGQQESKTRKPCVELPQKPHAATHEHSAGQDIVTKQPRGTKRKRQDEPQDISQADAPEEGQEVTMDGVEPTTPPEKYFFIDLTPTPVDQLLQGAVPSKPPKVNKKSKDKVKRKKFLEDKRAALAADTEPHERHKKKRIKTTADGPDTATGNPVALPQAAEAIDDFDAEVEARHRRREERRKAKLEKKRKWESEPSQVMDEEVDGDATEALAIEASSTKPKKKKRKAIIDSADDRADDALQHDSMNGNLAESPPDEKLSERKKTKKRKSTDSHADEAADTEHKKSKMNGKKDKAIDNM